MSNNERGVDVGACGPAYNPGQDDSMASYGLSGIPAHPSNYACMTPPRIDRTIQVKEGQVYSECFVPFGFRVGVDADGFVYPESEIGQIPVRANASGNSVILAPPTGVFHIGGLKTFNGPGEMLITSVITGDLEASQIVGPVDAASWNTDECFCIAKWGCISVTNGARISVRNITKNAAGAPTGLVEEFSGGFYGLRRQSLYACGPNYNL